VCIFALALALTSPLAYRDEDWEDVGTLTAPNDKATEEDDADDKEAPDSKDKEATTEGGAAAKAEESPKDKEDDADDTEAADSKDDADDTEAADSKDKGGAAAKAEDSPKDKEATTEGGAAAKAEESPKDKGGAAAKAEDSPKDKAEYVFSPALKSSDDLNDAAQGIEAASVETKTKAEELSHQFKKYQEQLGSTRDLLNDMSSEVHLFRTEVTDYFAKSESDKYSPIALEAQVDKKETEAIEVESKLLKEGGCASDKCMEGDKLNPDCCSKPSSASCADGYYKTLGAPCGGNGEKQVCCTEAPVECESSTQCLHLGGTDRSCCGIPSQSECKDKSFAKLHGASCGTRPRWKQTFCCKEAQRIQTNGKANDKK